MSEIIDISKYERKLYLISSLASVGIIILASIFFNEFIIYSLMILLFIGVLFGVDYYIKKDKVVLDLGNSLFDKHKDFRLTDDRKLVDKLRLRLEWNLDELEILERFKGFLLKNNLNQYQKVYVVGSNSSNDIEIVKCYIADVVN